MAGTRTSGGTELGVGKLEGRSAAQSEPAGGDGGREIGTVRSPVAFLKEGEPTSLQCMGVVQAGMGRGG